MGIFQDCVIATVNDALANIKLIWSSFITGAFQSFCEKKNRKDTGTDHFREKGTDYLRDRSSNIENWSEVSGSSSPYKISSPYIT